MGHSQTSRRCTNVGRFRKRQKTTHGVHVDYLKINPFCDGSHKVTAFKPVYFLKLTKIKKMHTYVCANKLKNKPYCDGSHHNK